MDYIILCMLNAMSFRPSGKNVILDISIIRVNICLLKIIPSINNGSRFPSYRNGKTNYFNMFN